MLQTKYLGLTLKNPVIVSSSGLTSTLSKVMDVEAKGAGSVVLKSLFEEQIKQEAFFNTDAGLHTEAIDYMQEYIRSKNIQDYLQLISDSKKNTKIPIIASINCFSSGEWIDFAKKIQDAGADALELNTYFIPTNKTMDSVSCEKMYLDLAIKIKKAISIPVSFKISSFFTNIPGFINQLYHVGINGVVLFNRFYEPDIDIDTMEFKSAEVLSTPSDIRHSLRWVGIVSGMVKEMDIAASTGIHDSKAAIKQLLAGAKAVQVCSALYKNGLTLIPEIVQGIESWMKKKQYTSIDAFRGKMNYSNIDNPALYERAQFMKYFSSLE